MALSSIDAYTAFLKQVLTPARLQHSQGVMQVMGELAGIYGLDRETALVTGLLHDAAKDLSPEEQAQMAKESNITFQHPCEQDYNLYLHGPVGAYYVSKMLGVTDTAILDAIWLHTWEGSSEQVVSPLAWCLRFADILEPYRAWDGRARILKEGMPQLREAVYAGRMEEGAAIQAELIIRFFDSCGMPLHPNYYRVLKGKSGINNQGKLPTDAV